MASALAGRIDHESPGASQKATRRGNEGEGRTPNSKVSGPRVPEGPRAALQGFSERLLGSPKRVPSHPYTLHGACRKRARRVELLHQPEDRLAERRWGSIPSSGTTSSAWTLARLLDRGPFLRASSSRAAFAASTEVKALVNSPSDAFATVANADRGRLHRTSLAESPAVNVAGGPMRL
jgi:hypothetical protein